MSGMAFGWRLLAAGLPACCAAALIAITVPVDLPETGTSTDTAKLFPGSITETAPVEDLDAFLQSRRWGLSLQDVRDAEAAEARQATEQRQTTELVQNGSSIHAARAKLGFVGLIVTAGQHEVLLKSPQGHVVRFAPGDTLPDGRTLVSVTDNTLVLQGDDAPEEVLVLFPRIRAESAGDGDHRSHPRPAQ